MSLTHTPLPLATLAYLVGSPGDLVTTSWLMQRISVPTPKPEDETQEQQTAPLVFVLHHQKAEDQGPVPNHTCVGLNAAPLSGVTWYSPKCPQGPWVPETEIPISTSGNKTLQEPWTGYFYLLLSVFVREIALNFLLGENQALNRKCQGPVLRSAEHQAPCG